MKPTTTGFLLDADGAWGRNKANKNKKCGIWDVINTQ